MFKRASMLVLFAGIAVFESRAQDQMPISFNNIPQWIEEHIKYPKDGAGYGIEQFCVSVTSDGIFINTLWQRFGQKLVKVYQKTRKL